MGNVLSRSDLQKQIEKLRQDGKRIVTTNGCFDLLHVGHVRFLAEAKKLGDILAVGLNSDASVADLRVQNDRSTAKTIEPKC